MPPLDDPNAPGGRPQTQDPAVLERTETVPQVAEPGDYERFSHYVRKEDPRAHSPASQSPRSAARSGSPGRDPRSSRVPHVKEIYDGLRAPEDGGE